ncbi:MAG TPA: hypothetical protein VNG31_02965 [Candidatus Baltobacteraceae bacterium]|nr:hypothetical protein [Candidatus Baltobacteraceae bacterium]
MKETRRMRLGLRGAVAIGALLLASCGRGFGPSVTPPNAASQLRPSTCYVTTVAPTSAPATITFYGWPDNTPPGNAIAHPVIHQVASGDGTYCNPTTFATEKSNDAAIPYGTKIYVPFLKQYFVREDLCAASGPPVGSGSNGCYELWFDLWIGGTAKSDVKALVACEQSLTPNAKVRVILHPGPGLPVAHAGPIYRNKPRPRGTCDGKPAQRRASIAPANRSAAFGSARR